MASRKKALLKVIILGDSGYVEYKEPFDGHFHMEGGKL